jgi:hypothetical protein
MTEMEHSTTLGALAKALAGAQLRLKDAKKDATNPHFRNRYASLASVREALSAVLPECGLSYVQSFEPHGDAGVCIVTTLLHESGEWIRSRLYLPVSKKDAQGFGSAISYGRRYSLAAIVGIATDDDDDAEVAVRVTPKAPASEPAVSNVSPLPNWEASAKKSLEDAKSMGELNQQWSAVYKAGKKLDASSDVLARLTAVKDSKKLALSGNAS